MIAGHAAPTGRDAFGATYEALRRGVLAGVPVGGQVGLVLLLREGIAAWMARGAAGFASVAPAANRDRRATGPLVSDEVHAAVVRVLASMALGGLEEMSV